jgi:hypothetical protein
MAGKAVPPLGAASRIDGGTGDRSNQSRNPSQLNESPSSGAALNEGRNKAGSPEVPCVVEKLYTTGGACLPPVGAAW